MNNGVTLNVDVGLTVGGKAKILSLENSIHIRAFLGPTVLYLSNFYRYE